MMNVHVLEKVQRHSALGIRFWDVATGNTVVQGLDVALYPRANPRARSALQLNRSGVYVAHQVPGLRGFEFSEQPPDELWATPASPYRIELSDPSGRFLPSSFDVDLPVRGLLGILTPWLSPAQPVPLPLETGSPPVPTVGVVPLFSAPARPLPEPLGVVYAQLRLLSSGAAAPWTFLAAAIDGKPRGLGVADAEGRVAVFFGYPDPPRRRLMSPPEQHNAFKWTVTLTAFRDDDLPVGQPPDLARLLSQLSHPCQVLESQHSPARPLHLDYRVPLTARSSDATGEEASYLLLAA